MSANRDNLGLGIGNNRSFSESSIPTVSSIAADSRTRTGDESLPFLTVRVSFFTSGIGYSISLCISFKPLFGTFVELWLLFLFMKASEAASLEH